MPDIERTLREFIAEWGKSLSAIVAAYHRYLTPDAVWEQQPLPTTRSVDDAVKLLVSLNEKVGMETFGAEILNLAVRGNIAFAERIDHLRRADGSLIATVPVTGVFEFNSAGRIKAWREYFDAGSALLAMGVRDPAVNS
jgi:limonene-1,2-epoxide hydrolase